MLSHFITEENSDWDVMLPYVLMAYCNRVHETTRESPFLLLFGKDMELPFFANIKPGRVRYDLDTNYASEMMMRMEKVLQQASQRIEETNTSRAEKANTQRKLPTFQVGDRVYHSSNKGKKIGYKVLSKME